MDNPQKEIMLDPRWSILEDGNGYQVLSLGGMPFVDKDGRRCIKFKVKPDQVVRKRYNLRIGIGGELDDDENMFIICLEGDIIPMNLYDDVNKKWLYVKSFRHEDTNLSEREIFLKRKLDTFEKKVNLLDAKCIKLQEELKLATLQTEQYLSRAGELIEKSAGAIATAIKKKEDDKN